MKYFIYLIVIIAFSIFAGLAFELCKKEHPNTFWPVFVLGVICEQACRWLKDNIK